MEEQTNASNWANGAEAPLDTSAAQVAAAPASAPSSCDALVEIVRERAVREMKQKLADQRRLHGSRCLYPGLPANCPNCGPSSPRASAPSARPGSAPSSVSQTNNQVAGVDEADLVKTEGAHMYLASGDALHVLSAWPAAETRTLARVPLKGRALKLFVANGRAVVYSALGGSTRAACTYGYDCAFTGDGSRTQVTVFDLKDPSAPRVVRELTLSGSLLAARRIERAVYTVVGDLPSFSYPLFPPQFPPSCRRGAEPAQADPQLDEAYRALERENEQRIRQADLRSFMPSIEDSAGAFAGRCDAPHEAFGASGLAFTTVHAFDLTDSAASSSQTIVSRPGATYVSESRLYLAVTDDRSAPNNWFPPEQREKEQSVVHSFQLGGEVPSVRYAASGVVPGHVLNQFAMDEWDGALRIATTLGRVPEPDVSSTISVLKQSGERLLRVGELSGLAPTEDIRSVRFVGGKGYVVTFKKTDPLFVFDLTDASAPKVLGELKIPGFSTYMHPLDEHNLLTIGYDADDQGSFAYFSGVLLQIFDVSNPRDPKLRHKLVIGTRGSSSEALTNHLAFNYFPDRKLLALPLTVCQGGQAGSFGTRMSFSGLMLFDVDLAEGIAERGRVAHPRLSTGGYDDASCSNWWTNASSVVKRSVFMDDFVYSIAEDVVRVQSLHQLGTDLATVVLAPVGVSPQE